MQLVWTPRARHARAAAIEFIAQNNPQAALAQLGEIERQIRRLQDHRRWGGRAASSAPANS